jgi:hypothetical protein
VSKKHNLSTAWLAKLRKKVPRSKYTIDSPDPRQVTALVHGPDTLAINFFPDVETPEVCMTEAEAVALTIKHIKRSLSRS